MEKIPDDILKHNIFPCFKNIVACCTDNTLYKLLFINKRFFKILSNVTFISSIYKIKKLSNKNLCNECSNFNIFEVIRFFDILKNSHENADSPYYQDKGTIHFNSIKEFDNFINFLEKNNIIILILISKCCGGKGGTFKYLKNHYHNIKYNIHIK